MKQWRLSTEMSAPKLVTYPIQRDQGATEAVLAAFEAIGVDLDEPVELLFNQIETDGLDSLVDGSNRDVRVETRLWGYPVTITADSVTIYRPEDG